jgi:hypothetical protein
VVYLDTRLAGASKFDAFQTSIAGAARGNDISLTNGAGYDPAGGASLGQRTSAAGFAAGGTTGVVRGYFPDASSDLGAVSEAELAHGTSPPALPAAGIAPAIPKNTAYNALSWLTFADPDGDPVTVTVDDPAHGSVASGLYSPDPTYAGTDTVRVRATDGITPVFIDHAVTVTNQAPVLDAPAPAIVDEGGAVVTVPLHAVDPDFNDAITYGISFAQAPLNAAGRATIVGSNLQLDIPAGVRSMAPLRITLRARDSTTGIAPGEDYQDLSVTIRPDLRTPSTVLKLSDIHITGARTTITAGPPVWDDPGSACLATTNQGCHIRRVWNFGDGSPSVTTTDQSTINHVYPRAGTYTGQLTTWVLWGSSQVAAPPKSFPIKIADDGRVVVAVKPSVKRLSPTVRKVTILVTARASGNARVYLNVPGQKVRWRTLTLRANSTTKVEFRVSIRKLKSRRATIRISNWGMLASTAPPPTDVYRPVILR